ncbi:permease [Gracilimonas sediminicola]|uniref:Permease n=1 Tax=Gracilimonas sediminicola TaxID=2952158 RepID=A0A9X2L605_9BACT|nr:permease [Gracilimonas sediminicola]MCP9293029.1 permease [Gracilimonas sediminicola]
MESFIQSFGESAKTALGFFWKAGWAFVLGYFVSGMIQAFVPKGKLTKYMGGADFKSISLSTFFGAASSSCSFAALAAARALIKKGAHFIAGVAFMFASTNLVIELGILILIFLGWQYLAAEIVGGLVLIAISSVLIRLTYPKSWMEAARKKVESEGSDLEEDFNWKKRIKSKEGWQLVGHKFVNDWKMAWEDILIGFTIAGFVAVLVPQSFWTALFLADAQHLPGWLVAVENALIAPFVAASTFIGSMGNIPLATVLNENGVLFAGIMGFIYSDLMVPPLVHINAKYYGWRVALYIAGIMYISIVLTALILNGLFSAFGIVPESARVVSEITQFKIDYTFWMNIVFTFIAGALIWLNKKYLQNHEMKMMEMESGGKLKKVAVILFILINLVGLSLFAYTQLL